MLGEVVVTLDLLLLMVRALGRRCLPAVDCMGDEGSVAGGHD